MECLTVLETALGSYAGAHFMLVKASRVRDIASGGGDRFQGLRPEFAQSDLIRYGEVSVKAFVIRTLNLRHAGRLNALIDLKGKVGTPEI